MDDFIQSQMTKAVKLLAPTRFPLILRHCGGNCCGGGGQLLWELVMRDFVREPTKIIVQAIS